ncbi:hypothetical protein [Planotetraspora kaengkrachanensis]|uniref:Uncharacterized protein n=1 Tax=Planotetraspora kaengkrachanensis TaxID=575193 RepID=A0A8J3LWV0_9ACTN|nr:hypothetical protein [Planotetraspora kaengkrachanensis]GIG80588.1 hypothetical protein Pka01_37150 [Planotetraspora kaengkrachanensis]
MFDLPEGLIGDRVSEADSLHGEMEPGSWDEIEDWDGLQRFLIAINQSVQLGLAIKGKMAGVEVPSFLPAWSPPPVVLYLGYSLDGDALHIDP